MPELTDSVIVQRIGAFLQKHPIPFSAELSSIKPLTYILLSLDLFAQRQTYPSRPASSVLRPAQQKRLMQNPVTYWKEQPSTQVDWHPQNADLVIGVLQRHLRAYHAEKTGTFLNALLDLVREYEPDLPQVFARSTVLMLGYTLIAVLLGRSTTRSR